MENFILRMAAEFPHRKEQLVFLINNYDMLLSVLSVRTSREVGGVSITTAMPRPPLLQERTSEESKESECFKSLLHARTQEFVEEVSHPPTLSPPSPTSLSLS